MDIGIGLPNAVPGLDGRLLPDWAADAEQRGFSTLGTIDRLLYPNYESLIALSAAAAVTERVRLMTDILISPYRNNTPLLAKQAVSLDNLSGGRLVLGLAPGWRSDDYRASGVDHAARGRILDEQLAEMTRLWRGESVDGLGTVGPEPAREGGPEIMVHSYYAQMGEEVAEMIADSVATDEDTVTGYGRAYEEAGADELIFFPCSTDLEQVERLAGALPDRG